MTATDKAPECVVVPRDPTREMLLAGYYPIFNYEKRQECYRAMLAARPDSGMVAVERTKIERWVNMLQTACDAIETVGLVSNRIENVHQELRALLSGGARTGDGG